jgi:flagellar assembly protein FliH
LSNVLRMNKSARTPIRIVRSASPKAQPAVNVHPAPGHRSGFEPMPLREVHADVLNAPPDEQLMEAQLQEAYERGRLQGSAEAIAARNEREEAERLAASERIASLLEHIAHQTSQFMNGLEQEAYRFAFAVAERIVKREIARDDSVVMRQMPDAIRRIIGVETITVRVHPDDEMLLRSHRPALLSSSDSVREIIIEGDGTVERGGCILEGATGNVDARIGSQLRQIESALFGTQVPPQESIE